MKKTISILLLAVLLLSVLPAAIAEPNEKAKLEGYSWKDARTFISEREWEGFGSNQKKIGMKLWVPNLMAKAELSVEDELNGYISVYLTQYGELEMDIFRISAQTNMEKYMKDLTKEYGDVLERMDINGIDAVVYTDPSVKNEVCRVASYVCEDGSIVEFVFYYKDKTYADYVETMIASIRPADMK